MRADALRNRERILDVAKTAFAADGLSVPLDDIARRAGVGPGTLYRHFPTKEDLFEAVMLDRLRRLAEEGAALRGSTDPGTALMEFIGRLVAEAAPKRDLFEALASAGIDVGAAVTEAANGIRTEIGLLLDRAQRAGTVRADIGMAELMALLSGMLFAAHARPSADRRLILDVLRDGLMVRRARPGALSPGRGEHSASA